MTHRFTDTYAIPGTRIRDGGYLVTDARVARTGVQLYSGAEMGRPDLRVVRVFRSEDEVFSPKSMASFANIPVTNDHPPVSMDAKSWSQYAVGNTDGEVARDGQRIRVPLMVSDATAIADVQSGKRELSNGYNCDIDWTPGTTPDGKAYDAAQRNIRGNHIAIVAAGRAGKECRIGDGAANWGTSPLTHADQKETPMSTLQNVVLGDEAVPVDPIHAPKLIAFKDAQSKLLADAKAETVAQKTAHDKAMAAKDAEIEDLKSKVMDDAAADARADARAKLFADAKSIAPDVKTVGFSDADIRKAVVSDKLGADKVANMSDAYLDARFDILVEGIAADKPDAFRDAAINGQRKPIQTDAKVVTDARAEYLAGFATNHIKTEA